MSTKQIKIKNQAGDYLHPETEATLVTRGASSNVDADLTAVEGRVTTAENKLATVAEGAQVNVIEAVKVNGTPLAVTDKAVDISITNPVYAIRKDDSSTDYAAVYYLTKDGVDQSVAINIPKDMVVQSGTVGTVTVADEPYPGAEVGDKYIDLVIQNQSEHLYIPANSLVDVYTAKSGGYLEVVNNEIGIAAASFDSAVTENSNNLVKSGAVYTAVAAATAAAGAVASDLATHEADAVAHLSSTEHTNVTAHLAATNNPHGVTAAQVGLGNVDNTSDADKPVSTATQTALDAKQDTIDATHKLDADLVDDSTATNKFVTAAEKTAIANAAVDSTVVHLAGAETVTGAKAFNAGLTSGETIAAGNSSTKVPTTAWVQGEIADFITYEEITNS